MPKGVAKKPGFRRWAQRRNRKKKAASVIQKAFRRRRDRQRVKSALKAKAVLSFNRSDKEMMYKSFTIVCPDYMLLNPASTYPNGGIACADTTSLAYTGNYELGALLKNPSAPNGVSIFSQELLNMCELYRQVRIVHGSVTLLKFSDGTGDGNSPAGVATPPGALSASSIGITGTKDWVSYMHSIVDGGSYRNVNDQLNISIPPATNISSVNTDEYLANSNSRMAQLSWDTKKSIKLKVIGQPKNSEWAQQYFGFYNNGTPPVAQFQLRTNQAWLDTNILENVAKNQYAVANPNYQSAYAIMRLPQISHYGSPFPTRLRSVGGVASSVQFPVHKVLISICCAFRVPTTRN